MITLEPYHKTKLGEIYHADCLNAIQFLKNNAGQISLVYTDPPYNVGKKYGGFDDKIPSQVFYTWIRKVYKEILDITDRFITHIPKKHFFEIISFLPKGQMIIVPRQCKGRIDYQTYWTDQYDILWAIGKTCYKPIPPNLWNGINLKGEGFLFKENDYGHEGYTPIAIARKAVEYMTVENDLVVDIFGGVGTTAFAAEELNRRWIVFEQCEEFCEKAAIRLSQPKQRQITFGKGRSSVAPSGHQASGKPEQTTF